MKHIKSVNVVGFSTGVYDSIYICRLLQENMSAFLFYRPNSNPNRYSRRERFSPRCTKSSSNVHTIPSQPSIEGSPRPVARPHNLTDRDNFDIFCRDNGMVVCLDIRCEALTGHQAHCPQARPANDRYSATSDKDCTSLHDPFPEPQTGRELVGTSMADKGHDDAVPQVWGKGGATSISNQSTIERNISARNSPDEPALAPASVDRDIYHVSLCQQSREAPPTPERQCFSLSSTQVHAQHTSKCIIKNNDFQPGLPFTLAEFAPPNTVKRSSLEDWGSIDATLHCRNSPHQDQSILEGKLCTIKLVLLL